MLFKKYLLPLIILLVITILLAITYYAAKKQQELRGRAATTKTPDAFDTIIQEEKPDYVPGEVLVKLKMKNEKLKIKTERVKAGIDVDKTPLALADLDTTDAETGMLANFLKEQGVLKMEKVFKGSGNAKEDIAEFKQRFPERASQIKPEAETIDLSMIYKLTFDKKTDVSQKIQALSQNTELIQYAEPNYIAQINLLPNDTYVDPNQDNQWSIGAWGQTFEDLWGLKQIGWQQIFEQRSSIWPNPTNEGGGGIVVAVIDSGQDYQHEDLNQNIWKDELGRPGKDFVDIDVEAYRQQGYEFDPQEDYTNRDNQGNLVDDYDPSDRAGHGTHVAGIIAALTDNGKGIAGVAWNSKIMPVRAGFRIYAGTGWTGLLEYDDIAASLYYATEQAAHIINMSFGGSESDILKLALDYAYNHGSILVAAAGNSDSNAQFTYPAAHPQVIAVAAIDTEGNKASFSNWGSVINVAAPGIEVLSLRAADSDMHGDGSHIVGEHYYRASGTSMAAPYVSGTIALLSSSLPNSSSVIIKRLLVTSEPIDSYSEIERGQFVGLGTGIINAYQSLTKPVILGISLKQFTINDNNNNKVPEPAERVEFNIQLENIWRRLSETVVRLRSNHPYVTIINDEQIMRDFLLGEVRVINFVLEIVRDVPWGQVNSFVLEIDSAGDRQTFPLSLILHGPMIKEGWPLIAVSDTDAMFSSPALADVDNDGQLESVIISSKGDIYVMNPDGTILPGWPIHLGGENKFSSPNVSDLDNDGTVEIIVAAGSSLYVLDADGRIVDGWPVQTGDTIRSSPAAGDIDGDGQKEIAVGSRDGYLYVFNLDGSSHPGWPVRTGRYVHSTPTLANLDEDEDLEILAGSGDGYLYALNHDGTKVSDSWPVYVGLVSTSSPAVGNLDEDGQLEVVIGTWEGKLYIINHDGSLTNHTPTMLQPYIFSSPSLGDINGDGKLEIVIGTGAAWAYGYVYSLDNNGNILPGWPVNISDRIAASPALADLDQDGRLEIIVGSANGQVLALRHDGSNLDGWPYKLNLGQRDFIDSSAAVGDMDNNGINEIIVGKFNFITADKMPIAYAIEYGDTTQGSLSWPMFHHDERRTGLYQSLTQEISCLENMLCVVIRDAPLPTTTNLRTARIAASQLGRINSTADVGEGIIGLLYLNKTWQYKWVIGTLIDDRPNTSPFDSQWHWHFDPATIVLADSTPEGCQTNIEGIETDLDYWLNFPGGICTEVTMQNIEPMKIVGVVERLTQPINGTNYLLRANANLTFFLKSDTINLEPYVGLSITAFGNPSLTETNDGVIIAVTSIASETIIFFPGWNVVKLPVDLINGLTAKTLLNDLNTHCASVGTKIRAIGLADNNSWQDYVSDFGGNDFQLKINRDYWLKSDGYCLYQPTGID